jgi:hypothetical protein
VVNVTSLLWKDGGSEMKVFAIVFAVLVLAAALGYLIGGIG